MGVLLAFFVGWAVGAKAGPSGYSEVIDAAKAVRTSTEFQALVEIARTHLAESLQTAGQMVSGQRPLPDVGDLLAQVELLTTRRTP